MIISYYREIILAPAYEKFRFVPMKMGNKLNETPNP
jgi:hypothetical protein